MSTGIKESRDADPVTMKYEDEIKPSSSPSSGDVQPASPKQQKKHSSNHKKHHTFTPYSPSSSHIQERYPSSPGHARTQSLGSPYRNAPMLIPHGPVPTSPVGHHSSHTSPIMTRSFDQIPATHGLAVPFLVNPVQPHRPRISQIQKAMEAAIVQERKRAKEMEAKEEDLGANELRAILKQERHRMSKIAADLAHHKTLTAQSQLEAEIMEEGRVNGLVRRLEELQLEKGRIVNELEREEEMLTNTLQKKLDQVRLEKAQLEKLLKDEKSSHSALGSLAPKALTQKDDKPAPLVWK